MAGSPFVAFGVFDTLGPCVVVDVGVATRKVRVSTLAGGEFDPTFCERTAGRTVGVAGCVTEVVAGID